MESRKTTNMVIRSMGQTILFSMVMFGALIYFLMSYGYMKPLTTWLQGVWISITCVSISVALGAVFGFYQSYNVRKRLETLRDSVLQMEKGNLSRPLPDLGEDEVGRLAEQLGRMSKKWEEQVSSLQRLSTNNAQLAEKARFTAIIEERQRLARELHDAVSQQLFAISMTATAVGRTLEKEDFDRAQRQVNLIEEMASVAQSEMRALLLHLRPVHLEGKPLTEGLSELLQEMKAKVPMDITFEMDEGITLLKGIENHLFRIVQEALSNTLRHSKANKMEVKLQKRPDGVRLMIRDNGVGFELDVKKQTSYGLSTMQERVNEIGGSLQFITAPGKGTRIEIRIPVLNEESGWGEANGDAD
ncbi:sensor histidine kinase [Paenibacillus selenitireducens]|uniref:Sensor histidine kinase n=1 Tax=Paenibacillus selenitireducens TaxID=1324314 RepID=A0A1T2XJA2_9BACL|nr:sensor histidine kinase [Paenibacillus selenitireducens]OPA79957.1 sensor histidine kinase [Paenibacillus selenitireducens]